jgi:hypothetical protein
MRRCLSVLLGDSFYLLGKHTGRASDWNDVASEAVVRLPSQEAAKASHLRPTCGEAVLLLDEKPIWWGYS